MQNWINFTLNNILFGYKHKKKIIVAPKSKASLKFLNILVKEGIISGFSQIKQNKKLIIKLKWHHQKPPFTHFKNYNKPSLKRFISYRELISLNYKLPGAVIIVTTADKGFINHKEAIKNKIGGKLICIIY